jgi:hypothetical protein
VCAVVLPTWKVAFSDLRRLETTAEWNDVVFAVYLLGRLGAPSFLRFCVRAGFENAHTAQSDPASFAIPTNGKSGRHNNQQDLICVNRYLISGMPSEVRSTASYRQ